MEEFFRKIRRDPFAEWMVGAGMALVIALIIAFIGMFYRASQGDKEAIEAVGIVIAGILFFVGPYILTRTTYRLYNWYDSFR